MPAILYKLEPHSFEVLLCCKPHAHAGEYLAFTMSPLGNWGRVATSMCYSDCSICCEH